MNREQLEFYIFTQAYKLMYQYESQGTSKTADGIAATIQNLLGTYLPSSDLSTVEECKDLQKTETGANVAANAWKDNVIFQLWQKDIATWLADQTKQVKPWLPGGPHDTMWHPMGPNGKVRNSMWMASINKVNELILVIPKDETTKTVQQVSCTV